MRIAIVGAGGQLGTDLVRVLAEFELFPLFYPDFDITKKKDIRTMMMDISPDIVINTAAYNSVDKAEREPARVFDINALAVRTLVDASREKGCVLVHLSSDYVFDGLKTAPYVEEDCPHPLNVYGASKLAGEHFIQAKMKRFYIIRTSSLFGTSGNQDKGYNFVDLMVSKEKNSSSIHVVNDQIMTPTSTQELAEHIKELIQTGEFGLYHLTNEGSCSWYEYAQTIFRMSNSSVEILPIDSKSYGSDAQRPHYSVLENQQANSAGLTAFSHWTHALRIYMMQKGYIKSGDSF